MKRRVLSCIGQQNEENTKHNGDSSYTWLLIPNPTGTSCFESSNFMDWNKYIPFPLRLLSTSPSE